MNVKSVKSLHVYLVHSVNEEIKTNFICCSSRKVKSQKFWVINGGHFNQKDKPAIFGQLARAAILFAKFHAGRRK